VTNKAMANNKVKWNTSGINGINLRAWPRYHSAFRAQYSSLFIPLPNYTAASYPRGTKKISLTYSCCGTSRTLIHLFIYSKKAWLGRCYIYERRKRHKRVEVASAMRRQ
jgi:hypothetical protein